MEPIGWIIILAVVILGIWLWMNREEEPATVKAIPESPEVAGTPEEPPVNTTVKTEPMTHGPAKSKIKVEFDPAEEDFPIASYTTLLNKTGRFNPHKGGNFFMENQQNDLLHKQGVLSQDEVQKQNAYAEGQYGRWGLQAISADDRRTTTSPYVGTTRSLRGVKIRKSDSIKPDKISDTMHPIM